MAYVSGTSESARRLEDLLRTTMAAIDSNIGDLESAMGVIRGGYQDSGVDDIEETIKSIKNAVEASRDGATNVEKALDAYASFLESVGR